MRKTLENQNGAVLDDICSSSARTPRVHCHCHGSGTLVHDTRGTFQERRCRRSGRGKEYGQSFCGSTVVLAQEFGQANFAAGYGGSEPLGTAGSVVFTASRLANNGIQVNGSVTALGYLSQLFGVNTVPITANGAARQNKAQIMLVLDRSGSMAGQPINDLRSGATSFVSFFKDTENLDKMGMVSFAFNVTVDVPLEYTLRQCDHKRGRRDVRVWCNEC